MATKNQFYDHPTYITRMGMAMGENPTAGGALQFAKFVAYTNMLAFQAVFTVTTAGTITSNVLVVQKISGTNTTVLGTATLGTNVQGSVVTLPFTAYQVSASGTTTTTATNSASVGGGATLIQGDQITTLLATDSSLKVAVSYEVETQPFANLIL